MKSVLLVCVYVCYLLLGAKIFQKLEQPAEVCFYVGMVNYSFFGIKVEKCIKAQMGIIESVANFGENYFYELNLNQKFCEGIGRAKELGDLEASYSTPIIKLFYYWHGENCSQTAYDKLFSVITSKEESFLLEFQKLFFGKIIENWKRIWNSVGSRCQKLDAYKCCLLATLTRPVRTS